jgi:DNA-binding NarL/FixJ family response regulator
MVIIDAKKHNLNWQQSEIDNNIQELKNKYQPKDDPTKPGGGVHTLISRAKSEERVPHRKQARTVKDPKTGEYLVKEGINVKTGEKVYEDSGYTRKQLNKKTGKWEEIGKTTLSTKMAEASDARDLMSGENHEGTPMERVYADYANKCKELGNKARKAYLEIDTPRADPTATKEYAEEVASLKSKLVQAQLNAPLERLAQVRGNETIKKMKKSGDSKYDSYSNADWKKEKGKALERARRDVGAKKAQIDITEKEWEAIQNRAVSPSLLKEILDNADLDKIRGYAMPKNEKPISLKMESRIKAYAASGKTQAEIAEALGISATTVNKVLT